MDHKQLVVVGCIPSMECKTHLIQILLEHSELESSEGAIWRRIGFYQTMQFFHFKLNSLKLYSKMG